MAVRTLVQIQADLANERINGNRKDKSPSTSPWTLLRDLIDSLKSIIEVHYGGMCYISTEGTQTIAIGGTFEKLYEGTMVYTEQHLDSFIHSNGRLTYAGEDSKHFVIMVHASIESDEANARIQIRIALNGVTIAATDAAHDFRATDTDAVLSSNWLIELAPGEYIEVFGTSDTNGDTFVVHNLTLIIVEME